MAEQKVVSDAMTRNPRCIRDTDSAREAAEIMTSLDVGVVPVCDADDRVRGIVTDRDITTKVIGMDKSPDETSVSSLIEQEPVTIAADMPLADALELMMQHKVRRLPVVDGGRLVGLLAMADVATRLPRQRAGELTHALSFD